MSDDLLATARLALSESEDPATVGPEAALHLAAWGTLAATIDAAETARAMHTTLEGVLQAVESLDSLLRTVVEHPAWREAQGLLETSAILRDPEMMAKIARGEADIAAGRTSTLAEVREALLSRIYEEVVAIGDRVSGRAQWPHVTTAPDAPATPQEGEVWEDPTGRVRVKIDRRCSSPTNLRHAWLWHGTVVASDSPSGWRVGDPVGMIELDQGDWRRVSPAPDAPATPQEGEVWEDPTDGEQLRVLRVLDDGWYRCEVVRSLDLMRGGHHTTRLYRYRRVSPAPDAPTTPQVGEVWVCRSPFSRREGWQCTVTEVDDEGNVYVRGPGRTGPYMSSYRTYPEWWRRVSPAPAPLTEAEVTAEAEAQGVEPASDAEVDEALSWTREEVPQYVTPEMAMGLIARVRAEQARAESSEGALEKACADLQSAWARAESAQAEVDAAVLVGEERLARMQARAEAAEARMGTAEAEAALMRDVVEAAWDYTYKPPGHTVLAAAEKLRKAIRAYREATGGE